MNNLKWKLTTFNNIEQAKINPEILLHEMLKNRGIENPTEWLNVSEKHNNNPALLKNITEAVKVINDAVVNNKKIYIQVDSDTDGMTSSGIMLKFLETIGNNEIVIGIHPGKEHGLDVKKALESEAELVIVPDASGNPEDYKKLKTKGINTLIIDHHEYEENLFDTVVVNCNFGAYPNKHLSGAGVTLKVCEYYCSYFNLEEYDFNNLYILASIGMVADVMSLQELENQYIIQRGLKYMSRHNFFVNLLTDRMGNVPKKITIKDIGWSIGPNLNAVIRLGSMEEKELLFTAITAPMTNVVSKKRGSVGEITSAYLEMIRICKNLKAKQLRMVNNSLEIIQENIKEGSNFICYIDYENELTFELSGLIANKLLTQYKKPVFLLRHFHDYENPTTPDCWAGSVRTLSAEGFENPKDIFSDFTGVRETGGHAKAFGIKIFKDGIDGFLAETNQFLKHIDFDNQIYNVELSLDVKEINNEIGHVFAAEDIWGSGLDKPLIHLSKINLKNAEFMGKNSEHVKINYNNIDVVIFNNNELIKAIKENKNQSIDAIGEISINTWDGTNKLQLIVSDYEIYPNPEDKWNITDF